MKIFSKKQTNGNFLQEQLEEKMLDLFDQVIKDRGIYYSKNTDKIPNRRSIDSVINSYANQNAVISGGAGLVPGPMGMLAIVPEIVLIVRNQLSMIYDIGIAYGYAKKLNAELLANIFGFALGSGTLGLLVIHSQKVLVKRASLRIMQRMVHLMAGKISQRLLKSMVSRWVPVAGAAALAAWSKFSTHKIAERAVSIFEKEISFSEIVEDDVLPDDQIQSYGDIKISSTNEFDKLKVQSLINLMCIDASIKLEERDFIKELINNLTISDRDRAELAEQLNQGKARKIDYSGISDSPDEAISLVTDLIGLAKRDGEFHISEKLYVKKVAKTLGFERDEIEDLMANC